MSLLRPAGAPTTAALALTDVACARGEQRLFSGVSAVVESGRLLWVRGANGAGKTTLLRTISGLSAPAAGRITWRGRPMATLRDAGRLVYLGHSAALKGELSALQNLQASRGLAGRPCSEPEALGALAQAGLRGREHLPVRTLSQGQRKRAALAQLPLATPPGLWVLDEPFDALDAAAADWLQRLIGAQLARGGGVVLTSHQALQADAAQAPVTIDLDTHRILPRVERAGVTA